MLSMICTFADMFSDSSSTTESSDCSVLFPGYLTFHLTTSSCSSNSSTEEIRLSSATAAAGASTDAVDRIAALGRDPDVVMDRQGNIFHGHKGRPAFRVVRVWASGLSVRQQSFNVCTAAVGRAVRYGWLCYFKSSLPKLSSTSLFYPRTPVGFASRETAKR